MSKAEERLRSLGIVNPYGVMYLAREVGVPPVAIVYEPADNRMGGHGARWQVHHATERTAPPGAHFQDHGRKSFNLYGREGDSHQRRESARLSAVDWTNAKYGTDEWSTVPGMRGALFPKPLADHVRKILKGVKA